MSMLLEGHRRRSSTRSPPELVAAIVQASLLVFGDLCGGTLADTVEDLDEHLDELFGRSDYERIIDALERRRRRSKPSGPHPATAPAHSVEVATYADDDHYLIGLWGNFQFLDPEEEAWRRDFIEFVTCSPTLAFAPWKGGPAEAVNVSRKSQISLDEAERIVPFVCAIEEAASELRCGQLRKQAAAMLRRTKRPPVPDPNLGAVLSQIPASPSAATWARHIVDTTTTPTVLSGLGLDDRLRLTEHLVVRFGWSSAGGRRHVFKRDTLVDWLAHAPHELATWLRRIGDEHLACELERALAAT